MSLATPGTPLIQTGAGFAAAASKDTAVINPTAGSATIFLVSLRSADLLDFSGDTISISGARGVWSSPYHHHAWDASDRVISAVFVGTGSVTEEAITVTTVAGTRTFANWNLIAVEITGQDATTVIVQSDFEQVAGGAGTAITIPTLAAWGSPNNWALWLGVTDHSASSDMIPEGAYTALVADTTLVYQSGAYFAGEDTDITGTKTAGRELYVVGMEIKEAVAPSGDLPHDAAHGAQHQSQVAR